MYIIKNSFNGKKKGISLLIICLLLVGFVVIRYTSLNKKITTLSTTSGDNKEANSQTEENKENGVVAPTENNENKVAEEKNKGSSSVAENTSTTDKKESNTGNTTNKGNSGSSNQGLSNTSKPENKPATTSKPENKPSKPNNDGDTKPSHSHNWVAQTKQVHHKEQGHYENVLVKPAWTEEVPIYEERERSICNGCGADITGNTTAHNKKHVMNGEKGGWHSEWKRVQVGTKKVHHDAVYKKKWVVDKKAWTETVTTGYQCSCGETK